MKTISSNKIWTDDQMMALKPVDRRHELWLGILTGNSVLPGFRFAVSRHFEDLTSN